MRKSRKVGKYTLQRYVLHPPGTLILNLKALQMEYMNIGGLDINIMLHFTDSVPPIIGNSAHLQCVRSMPLRWSNRDLTLLNYDTCDSSKSMEETYSGNDDKAHKDETGDHSKGGCMDN